MDGVKLAAVFNIFTHTYTHTTVVPWFKKVWPVIISMNVQVFSIRYMPDTAKFWCYKAQRIPALNSWMLQSSEEKDRQIMRF